MIAKGDTRSIILDTISQNPGLHFRELQRKSGMATGQLEYHLYQLEKENVIVKKKDGKMLRYFSNVSGTSMERSIVFYLRNRITREIILTCLAGKGNAPAKYTEKWLRNASFREELDRLIDDGIIVKSKDGLSLTDRQGILDVLAKYRVSFLDSMASALISLLGP